MGRTFNIAGPNIVGWLVLFDLRKERSWAERLTRRDVAHLGRMIHIVGS